MNFILKGVHKFNTKTIYYELMKFRRGNFDANQLDANDISMRINLVLHKLFIRLFTSFSNLINIVFTML